MVDWAATNAILSDVQFLARDSIIMSRGTFSNSKWQNVLFSSKETNTNSHGIQLVGGVYTSSTWSNVTLSSTSINSENSAQNRVQIDDCDFTDAVWYDSTLVAMGTVHDTIGTEV